MGRLIKVTVVSLGVGLVLALCSPEGDEPEVVSLQVTNEMSARVAEKNDLGWSVELSTLDLAIANLEFTIQGEAHSRQTRLRDCWIASAYAHPGHYAGGEVTGELPGKFVIEAFGDKPRILGEARLLVGDYNGLNFYFRTATGEVDGLSEADALRNHTAHLEGIASDGSLSIPFEASIDIAENTEVVGAPFDLGVEPDTKAKLGLRILPKDENENRHLFDGIDFGSLPLDDGVASIRPGDEAHNILMKALVRHNFYRVDVL